MKKEKNTTFIPPSTAVEGADLRQGGASPSPAAKKKSPKRKIGKKQKAVSVTTLPDDEFLQEALDDMPEYDEMPMDEPEDHPEDQNLSPTERRRQKKQLEREQELSALELVRQKSGLTDDDIAMIFELGYENELGRIVGYENLKRLKNDHLKRTGASVGNRYRTAFGYRGEEFTGEQNQDAIAAAYAHDRKKLILRTVLSAFFTLLVLFADMPNLIAAQLPPALADNRFFFPLLGMGLLICAVLPSIKQLIAGLRSLLDFHPTPYSIPALLLQITLIYDLLALSRQATMLRVNFLTAAMFLLIVICDVLRFSCEARTLRLLSEEGAKNVLVAATPRKKKLRQGNKIVKIINDDIGENRYQVRQSLQTVGFFRRFNDMDATAKPLSTLVAISFSLATVLAFANAIYTGGSAFAAMSAFMTVLFITAPISSIFAFFYPICRANRLLAQKKCALIGEEAIVSLDTRKTVIFPDTDLYVAEKCTDISIREGDDFKNDMRLAGILFRKLGGTLAKIGEAAPNAKADPPVNINRVLESGVEALIDNRYQILAGDGEFLMRNGVKIPRETTDKALRRTSEVSLMYVAIDGILKLSYEIEYSTKPTFERMIRDLVDANCEVAISSYDPNLDEVFVQKSRSAAADPISVIKPNRWEEEKPLEMADAEAIALDDPHDLVYTLYAANAIGKTRRFAFRMQWIAALLGSAAAVLFTLLNWTGLLGIVAILCYHLLWVGVLCISGLTEMNCDKLHLKRK